MRTYLRLVERPLTSPPWDVTSRPRNPVLRLPRLPLWTVTSPRGLLSCSSVPFGVLKVDLCAASGPTPPRLGRGGPCSAWLKHLCPPPSVHALPPSGILAPPMLTLHMQDHSRRLHRSDCGQRDEPTPSAPLLHTPHPAIGLKRLRGHAAPPIVAQATAGYPSTPQPQRSHDLERSQFGGPRAGSKFNPVTLQAMGRRWLLSMPAQLRSFSCSPPLKAQPDRFNMAR